MTEQILEIVVNKGFNYYNYFTEVEEAFVKRRGAPMLISPLDWSLIESWKTMGIPLHIVLRAINKSFEHYNPEASRGKRVNTIFYCQQEVMSNFKDYVDSQVGASPNGTTAKTRAEIFPKQEVINFINERRQDLEYSQRQAITSGLFYLSEALARAVKQLTEIAVTLNQADSINTEALERDLTAIEDLLFESVQKDVSPSRLAEIRDEAERELRPHKKRMEAMIYQQTLENYIAKRLRENHFIPRLSLFYM